VWVLTNLVANALRHTAEGGWIRVGAATHAPFVHLSVADNGVGIPRELQGRIFGKFVRAEGERLPGGQVWAWPSAGRSCGPTGAPSGWSRSPDGAPGSPLPCPRPGRRARVSTYFRRDRQYSRALR
jgi:hypothetical protein